MRLPWVCSATAGRGLAKPTLITAQQAARPKVLDGARCLLGTSCLSASRGQAHYACMAASDEPCPTHRACCCTGHSCRAAAARPLVSSRRTRLHTAHCWLGIVAMGPALSGCPPMTGVALSIACPAQNTFDNSSSFPICVESNFLGTRAQLIKVGLQARHPQRARSPTKPRRGAI